MDKSEQMALRFTRRAEELRAIAENVKDEESREAMLKWASDYDRMAERAMELEALSGRQQLRRGHDQLGSDPT